MKLNRIIREEGMHNFIILGLECVSSTATHSVNNEVNRRVLDIREQFWISRLNTIEEGHNIQRVIAAHANDNVHRRRLHRQREVGFTAQHLLNYFVSKDMELPADHIARFSNNKLLMLVHTWAFHAVNTPEHKLCLLVMNALCTQNRTAHDRDDHALAAEALNLPLTLPFTSFLWDSFPIQKLLDDPVYRETLPLDSSLRTRLFKVRFKYACPVRLPACNYPLQTHADKQLPLEDPCSCLLPFGSKIATMNMC